MSHCVKIRNAVSCKSCVDDLSTSANFQRQLQQLLTLTAMQVAIHVIKDSPLTKE